MAKMHELIAAEPSVAASYNAMREETLKVFDRPDAFIRTVTTRSYFDEDQQKLNTQETKELTTTVTDRLQYLLGGSFVKYIDLELQKDKTNQAARADLVVGGQTLAKDVPATLLLQLEKELATVRTMIQKAPTLQAGPIWSKDENEGLYVTLEPQVSFATKKMMRPVVLVEATDKFPAQVDRVNEDVPIAKIEKKVWSGALTSREKADILTRVDALLVAAKKARMRANNQEADKSRIGQTLAGFILNGPADIAEDE